MGHYLCDTQYFTYIFSRIVTQRRSFLVALFIDTLFLLQYNHSEWVRYDKMI